MILNGIEVSLILCHIIRRSFISSFCSSHMNSPFNGEIFLLSHFLFHPEEFFRLRFQTPYETNLFDYRKIFFLNIMLSSKIYHSYFKKKIVFIMYSEP